VAVEQARLFEDAVNARRAAGSDVVVEHHEGQPAVAFEGEEGVEVNDGFLFLGFKPVVAGDPGVVFVGLAVAVFPGVPLGGGDTDPEEEAGDGNTGLAGPAVDEVHEGVTGIVGNPASL
jgi:hypothetical protein